jgi:hypothetical protein
MSLKDTGWVAEEGSFLIWFLVLLLFSLLLLRERLAVVVGQWECGKRVFCVFQGRREIPAFGFGDFPSSVIATAFFTRWIEVAEIVFAWPAAYAEQRRCH